MYAVNRFCNSITLHAYASYRIILPTIIYGTPRRIVHTNQEHDSVKKTTICHCICTLYIGTQ